MRRREVLLSAAAFAAAGALGSKLQAQELVNDESAPLFLTRVIPIPDTPGRFDHMSVDNKRGLVFATVFGNDTVEVLVPAPMPSPSSVSPPVPSSEAVGVVVPELRPSTVAPPVPLVSDPAVLQVPLPSSVLPLAPRIPGG